MGTLIQSTLDLQDNAFFCLRAFLGLHRDIYLAPVVAISPDMGERYADTVYNPAWVADKFGVHIDDLMTSEVAL